MSFYCQLFLDIRVAPRGSFSDRHRAPSLTRLGTNRTRSPESVQGKSGGTAAATRAASRATERLFYCSSSELDSVILNQPRATFRVRFQQQRCDLTVGRRGEEEEEEEEEEESSSPVISPLHPTNFLWSDLSRVHKEHEPEGLGTTNKKKKWK